ncbi:MAG: hypothetical protein KGJ62_06360 [Armatimonadetes bacterium]|nr:hypothetical protein [Armatimonadota bacterium]MDE2206538.1 hypothetical protein [Armatimonadota bacterium]
MKQQCDVFASFEPIDDGFLRRDWTVAQLPASWLAESTELAVQRTQEPAARLDVPVPGAAHRLNWLADALPSMAVRFPCETPPEERMPADVLAAVRGITLRLFPDARPEELSDSAMLENLGWPDVFELTADIGRVSQSMVFRDEAALRHAEGALSGLLVHGPLTGPTPAVRTARSRKFTCLVSEAIPCVVSVLALCMPTPLAVDLGPVWAALAAGILLT